MLNIYHPYGCRLKGRAIMQRATCLVCEIGGASVVSFALEDTPSTDECLHSKIMNEEDDEPCIFLFFQRTQWNGFVIWPSGFYKLIETSLSHETIFWLHAHPALVSFYLPLKSHPSTIECSLLIILKNLHDDEPCIYLPLLSEDKDLLCPLSFLWICKPLKQLSWNYLLLHEHLKPFFIVLLSNFPFVSFCFLILWYM